jgi:signal transduction histidine kinase
VHQSMNHGRPLRRDHSVLPKVKPVHVGYPVGSRRAPIEPMAPRLPAIRPDTDSGPIDTLPILAHELRGPLAAMLASAEMLIEDFDTLGKASVHSMLLTLRRQAVFMQTIMENFFCSGAIDRGCFFVRPEALQLGATVEDVREMVAPLFERKGQIVNITPHGELPTARADRERISQLLLNLLLNASKFSGPGEIDLRLETRDRYVRVAVCDRGAGIPEEEQEKVFQRAYRLSPGGRANTEGLGLGLFICKAIVEAHGGRIGIECRRRGGTRAWFELPIVDDRG